MKKYYAIYSSSYGLTVAYLGEFEDFSGADEAESKRKHTEMAIWISDEEEIRGLLGSIQHILKS